MRTATTLAAILTLPALLCAQQTKMIPAGAGPTNGNASSVYPTGYGGGLAQQIVLAQAVTSGAALLREVRWRIDTSAANAPKLSFSTFNFSIGTTTVSPGKMSPTFASNRTSPLTQVFSGKVDLPAQTGTPSFNVIWKFPTPYLYQSAKGNLILEWEIPQPAFKPGYFIDAHKDISNQGSHASFGSGGMLSTKETLTVYAEDTQLQLGGSMNMSTHGLSKQFPALALFGFSKSTYGPLPLPLDLTPLGAPGNSLYVSMDLLLPCTWTVLAGQNYARAGFSIPNAPGLAGFQMYGQTMLLDSAANAFGIVMSPGLDLNLPFGEPITTLIGSYNYQASSGNGTAGQGMVLEFEGVLP